MTFLELLELEKEALLNPHYQYKDLIQSERDDLAKLSFARLTVQDQNSISTSWRTYCDKHKITFDLKDAVRLRFMAQSNLFFLCKFLEKYSSVTINTHEEICNDFFVSKDPAHYKTFEDFAKSYNGFKERLLLVPRGGFKSSIDIADCVQWIICFPEVTILILTGVYKLATDFVGELREHFTLGETGEVRNDKPVYGPKIMNDGNQSLFQVLFPEHCVKPGGASTEFQTPACKMPDKEPTVMSASIEQSLSGWHFCLDPETWVYVEDGLRQVKDFKIGEKVLTHKGRYRRVEALAERTAPKYKITFKKLHGFPITCSDSHPFLTDSGWVDAKDLVPGSLVLRPTINEAPTPPIPMDLELWNALGWWVAEGSLTNGSQVFYAGHKDEWEIFDRLGKLFVKYGASGYRLKSLGDGSYKEGNGIGLWINKTPKFLRDVFKSMYVAAFRKQIPSWILNAPKEFLLSFCNGLWDGDGDCRGSLTTVSKEIAGGALLAKQQLGLEQSCSKVGGTSRTMRVWGNIGKYEGRKVNSRLGNVYSVVEKVEKIEDGKVISVKVEEDNTICLVGAITHNCIMKLDDVVTNENSMTLTRMETVNRQASINKAMLHPFGFVDKIGTWYHELDLYGCDLKYEKQLAEQGEAPSMLVYLKAAWYPTEQAKKEGKIEENMKESDWILWFPERLPYKFLIKEKKKDPEGFAIKYLNDPTLVHQVKFPRELLIQRTVNASTLPNTGMIVSTWDTAYSIKSFADYTVGITALIYGGRFYIIDMVRGRFNEYELPRMIAESGYKWKPKRIAIEDSMGVRWINREIRREMDRLGISIPVEFVPLGAGNKAHSKEMKAKPVLRLLGDERLYFSNSCAGLEELYAELEKFPNGTHDDIVSALSILVDQYAAYADMDGRVNFVRQDYVADQKSKEMHDRIYCLGRYATLTENNMMDMSFNKQQELGQVVQTVDSDPLSELLA